MIDAAIKNKIITLYNIVVTEKKVFPFNSTFEFEMSAANKFFLLPNTNYIKKRFWGFTLTEKIPIFYITEEIDSREKTLIHNSIIITLLKMCNARPQLVFDDENYKELKESITNVNNYNDLIRFYDEFGKKYVYTSTEQNYIFEILEKKFNVVFLLRQLNFKENVKDFTFIISKPPKYKEVFGSKRTEIDVFFFDKLDHMNLCNIILNTAFVVLARDKRKIINSEITGNLFENEVKKISEIFNQKEIENSLNVFSKIYKQIV